MRRSELGGAYLWVKMPDGVEVGNLAPLCWKHHQEITENKERISYQGGMFTWTDGRPLTPQPPVKLETLSSDLVEAVQHISLNGEHEPEICPTCNRKLPKPKLETPPEERKPRGTWAVAVPMDERENGADTLDALLEAAKDELDKIGISYGDGSNVKFYPLCTALGLFVQHAHAILSDG